MVALTLIRVTGCDFNSQVLPFVPCQITRELYLVKIVSVKTLHFEVIVVCERFTCCIKFCLHTFAVGYVCHVSLVDVDTSLVLCLIGLCGHFELQAICLWNDVLVCHSVLDAKKDWLRPSNVVKIYDLAPVVFVIDRLREHSLLVVYQSLLFLGPIKDDANHYKKGEGGSKECCMLSVPSIDSKAECLAKHVD